MRLPTTSSLGDARPIPGARARLIADEYEYVDASTCSPTVDRTLLDPLETGEPVVGDAWKLPGEAWRSFDGMYAPCRSRCQ
jgi:hypothetical protein